MDSNPLEDLLGQKPEEEDQHVEPPAEDAAVKPEVEVAEAEPEPVAKPTATEPAHAPISALLDEREKRQAAERKAKELEDRWAQAQRPPPSDAEAIQQALYDQRLEISRAFAEQKYGEDIVKTVHEWAFAKCNADPYFNGQIRASRFPYEAAMQAYNRETIAAKVTPERLAAFEAWEAAQAQAQAQQPEPQQPAATPPRSLVNAPGTGLGGKRDTPPEEGAAYAAAIPQ